MDTRDNLHVLLVAPTGRDAELISRALHGSDVLSETLTDVVSAVETLRGSEVGALLIAEEALGNSVIGLLSIALSQQPSWSLLPVLILTKGGRERRQSRHQHKLLEPLGDVTLLERPIRVSTLVSSVKAALRARSDQYVRRNAEMVLRHNEKLAAVGRVASSIAHEINNPLEAVTNLLYLLDGTSLSEEQRQYLDQAASELARVSEIASHTLTFNRQRGVKGEVSVHALMDSVLGLYHGRMAASGISVERRYRDARPIICNPGELRQVFANLIGNAFDATRNSGGIRVRVRETLHMKKVQCGIRVTVADTGYGMEDHVKEHLFEPFSSTKGNNGSGLGLSISKGIIERHCGWIHFRSSTSPGRCGTVFSVFIPYDSPLPRQDSWNYGQLSE